MDRALGRSEKHMKRFGSSSAKTSGMVSRQMRGAAKAAAGMAAGYASIAGAKQAVSATEDLAKATIGLNKNLGIGVERASQWAAVAKVRGIETKALNMSFGTLAKNSQKAAEGGKTQTEAFEKLGITQERLKKMSFDQTLGAAADGFAKMEPGAKRTSVAMQLFGRGWQTIVPVLRDGSKGMEAQLALANKYGATFGGKSVKSMQDFIAAQREAKFASLGLQVAFGTQVAPALTKVINKVSTFVRQMREGTGAGGQFAARAKEIADKVKAIVGPIGQFVSKHPGLQKMGVAILGVGLALKALRFGAALSGIDKVASGLGTLARTKAGQRMKESIASGLSGLAGRLKGVLSASRRTSVSTMSSVGGSAGRSMASSTSNAAGGQIVASAGKGGKLGASFAKAGRIAGRAFGVAGAALAVYEIGKAIDSKLDKMGELTGDRPTGGRRNPIGDLLDAGGKLLGRRKGGRVPAFAAGGSVPVRLSPGEMGIEPGGRSFMVPGRPVAADSVGAMVQPGTKILTGSGQAMMSMGASVDQALMHQAPHFAHGGKVHAGKYNSTSYGPPWNAMNGTGVTKTGVNLKGAPKVYGVAVDPRMIPLGSSLSIDPNPFGTKKPFRAFDIGGAIKGNRIDFYDWRGRSKQMGWGRRSVSVTKAGSGGRGRGGSQAPRRGSVSIPAGITNPLLGNIMSPLVDDALLGGIEAGRNRTGRTGLLTSVLEGIAPESGDYATRRRFEVAAASPRRRGSGGARGGAGGGRGGFRPGGGWAGTKNLVMKAISGINQRRTFKRSRAINGNMNSDHNTWIKNAFAADISPGGDGVFSTIAGRLGIPARKGSWNMFLNKPIRGFKSQLLWHAPDGSHKDHVHLGIRKMRRGGVVGAGYRKGTRRGGVRRVPRRQPRIGSLIRGLAGNPGNRGAQSLTQSLSKRVGGRSMGALLRARTDIRKRIRTLAKPYGGETHVTGPARIQIRRLRGALSFIEDEMGRPIGRALGTSDEYQDTISRSMGNLDNELTVAGIDPESAAGVARKVGRTSSALGALSGRRAALGSALTRARASGNRAAVDQVQTEINEVDDQILGLRADLKTLSKATTEASTVMADAQRELAESNKALAASIDAQNANFNSATAVTARQLQGALTDMVSGTLGGRIGQRAQTAGTGQLARY